MAKGRKNKADIAMTPEMQRFQYEVAQELGLTGKFTSPEITAATKNDQTLGKKNKKKNI